MKLLKISLVGIAASTLFGCAQAPIATIPARQIETQKITLGNVQQVVKKGAPKEDVIAALSSPNIVTSNPDGTETWVYDKVSTEAEVVANSSFFRGDSAVAVKSTRTMIVVIRFDKTNKVDTVTYRQTSY